MYSLVVGVPFSPLDIDIGHLARGEWNALTDRFRLWYLPGEERKGQPICYVMIRKVDHSEGVVVYAHVVANTGWKPMRAGGCAFTVGIMSNDDVRTRVVLNSLLEIPPSFHQRKEIRVIERRWRSDPDATLRFLANVHSSMPRQGHGPEGKAYTLKFQPPPGMIEELGRNIGSWWD